MRRASLLLCALGSLAGCASPGHDACVRARECCSSMAICEDINAKGQGFEERCGIQASATSDSYRSYGTSTCSAIADAYDRYVSCLAGATCADIQTSSDVGRVSRCDGQARDLCLAQQASGDACGADYRSLKCDGAKANLRIYATGKTLLDWLNGY